jgi:hypothetical protein
MSNNNLNTITSHFTPDLNAKKRAASTSTPTQESTTSTMTAASTTTTNATNTTGNSQTQSVAKSNQSTLFGSMNAATKNSANTAAGIRVIQPTAPSPAKKQTIANPYTHIDDYPQEMDGIEDDATLNNNNHQTYEYKQRYDIKLHLPMSADPATATSNLCRELFKTLKHQDNTIALLPWYDNSISSKIRHATQLPPSINGLKSYFPSIWEGPGERDHNIYTSIYICHNDHIADLKDGIREWLIINKHGLFERILQCDQTAEIGWLAYSTKVMNTKSLSEAISASIEIPIGLRWKVIDLGKKGKIPANQAVRALHVEVAKTHQWQAQRALKAYYGGKEAPEDGYPLGIKLRFVTPRKHALNTRDRQKVDRLRQRQNTFSGVIETQMSEDIAHVDWKPSHSDYPTLRDMVMSLSSTIHTNQYLFLSIDYIPWKGLHYFQYYAHHEEEAQLVIFNLIPILRYLHGDVIENSFSAEAIERARGNVWDPEKKEVVSQQSAEEDFECEDDDEDGFSQAAQFQKDKQAKILEENQASSTPVSTHQIVARPAPQLLQNMLDGEDSVSTLGGQTQASANNNFTVSRIPTSLTTTRSTTDSVSGSVVTMESFVTLESQVQLMQASIKEESAKTTRMLMQLMSQLKEGNPPQSQDNNAGDSSAVTGAGL